MYDVIQMTDPHQSIFSLDNVLVESTDDMLYMEAVFTGGKEKLNNLLEGITKVQELLLQQISEDSNKKFDPVKYWKDNVWKELENTVCKTFGFRYVSINPFIEKFVKADNQFESHELQAYVVRTPRFPIIGLVTDSGFYDKSRSVDMYIDISLGIIKDFTPEEILAVFLHEFGHCIDPALTDISYTGTNILCKYLTDRKGAITKEERKAIKETKSLVGFIFNIGKKVGDFFKSSWEGIKRFFMGKQKYQDKQLEKLRKAIGEDKTDFTRQEYSEAFADNFARMYGYGPQLMSALKKMNKHMEDKMNSWFSKEREREWAIFSITQDALKDEHKTSIHRIRSLIKEYHADIDDPNTPKDVKKALESDLKMLEDLLDTYTKDFSKLQNRVNQMIIDELELQDKEKEDNNDEKK